MQLWVDGTIRYRKWTPVGKISPFPLVQGSQLTADLSRDCGQDLFTTTVDRLFGSADRIRFVSLSPPPFSPSWQGARPGLRRPMGN